MTLACSNGLHLQSVMMLCFVCSSVSFKFGVIAMFSGLLGVPLGPLLAQIFRSRFPRVDPLVCAGGLMLSAPICFFAILTPTTNKTLCYSLIFFGELFLNLNWSIVADILLVSIASSGFIVEGLMFSLNLNDWYFAVCCPTIEEINS